MPRSNPAPDHISRENFLVEKPRLDITLAGVPVPVEAKEFSTGTLGWQYEGTTEVLINGEPTKVWGKFLITINGSKKL